MALWSRRSPRCAGSTAVLMLLAGLLMGAAPPAAEGPRLLDLDGRRVDPLAMTGGTRALVVVFVSVDCPISNRYAPGLRRLHDQFAPQGARFVLVYPNPAESPEAIRAHLAGFGHPGRALRDPDHALVKAAGITVTPEAVVYDQARAVSYRGRIDDRYVRIGVERPAPTRHNLADALAATLAGRRPEQARTEPVGCYVSDLTHLH